jgi:outer membrane protein insertion porin family
MKWIFVAAARLAVLCSVLSLVHVLPALSQQSFSSISVEGNARIDDASIVLFSGIEPGAPVSEADLNAGLQRLFDTGLFEDVSFSSGGGGLLITVVENPIINIINFEGNDFIEDEDLATVITLRERRAYSRQAAEADANRIAAAYSQSGRFNAEVIPRIIRLDDNQVNLVFEISEGRVTEIQRITIVGNQAFSDRRLRRVLESGQAGLFSFLFSTDTYSQDRLEADKERLRQFYLERGYIDIAVQSASAEFARERNAFFLSFSVSEGRQYRYGKVGVSVQAPGIDPAQFEALVDLRPGQVYDVTRVERLAERMSFLAAQQGYTFLQVNPRLNRNEAGQTVDLTFELSEGPRVFVERIDIRGNSQTLDRVIRRQFRVVEGDAFNVREIRAAEQRIRALQYFETVDVRVREGSSPSGAVVGVEVTEAATGSLNFGAAYSSSDGPAGTISIIERNFLGRGQTLGLDFSNGTTAQILSLSFTEPALFDQDLLAGFELYYEDRERDESSINVKRVGFEPRIGFPLSERSRLTLRYRISEDDISVPDPDSVSPLILADEGALLTSSIGFNYTYDRRNSPVDPTAGFILSLEQDFAGLGGDLQYSKTRAKATAYTALFDEEVVLSGEVEGGALVMLDGNSRITDRFFLGGDSLRGFATGGIGPRDRCEACVSGNDIDDSLGGNMFAVARVEASFPIGLPEQYGIYGGLFADIGTVWDLGDVGPGASGVIDDDAKLRSSVGVSLFWDTAIGPLRFNYGIPVMDEDGDEEERFRLTIDTRF